MFFEGFTPEQLVVLLAGAIIAISQAIFPGVSILEYLKDKYNLADTRMELITMTFFFIMAGVATLITGGFEGETFTLQAILTNTAIFKGIAKIAYEMFKERNGI